MRPALRSAALLAGLCAVAAGARATLPSYESLMETVRRAQDDARRVFSVAEMHERADAVRAVLNQLAPYFDPEFTPLAPPERR